VAGNAQVDGGRHGQYCHSSWSYYCRENGDLEGNIREGRVDEVCCLGQTIKGSLGLGDVLNLGAGLDLDMRSWIDNLGFLKYYQYFLLGWSNRAWRSSFDCLCSPITWTSFQSCFVFVVLLLRLMKRSSCHGSSAPVYE